MSTDRSCVAEYDACLGNIVVVEDNPSVLTALDLCLKAEGHRVILASDGVEALNLLAQEDIRPDLILADYNLPRGMNGVQFSLKVMERLDIQIPVIILTGDVWAETSRDVAIHGYVGIKKPITLLQLTQVIQNLLSTATTSIASSSQRAE